MISLVNMPAADVTRPSLALGILKAALQAAGMSVRVDHANLWYFEAVGPAVYEELLGTSPADMVVEWIFGAAAFPDHAVDDDEFIDLVRSRDGRLRKRERSTLRRLLVELRREASSFVDEAASRVLAGP